MDEHWIVIRESDADDPKGAVHLSSYSQEGPARSDAEAQARSTPGKRMAVYRRIGVCEASVTSAEWEETTDADD